MKIIFHLDLDSFFVSAHRLVDSSLNDKAVIVSGGGRRSIVTAASYEAKKLGVVVPFPFYKAKELVPNITIVRPDFALYRDVSSSFFEHILKKYTEKIEIASIDECYADVSDLVKDYDSALKLAKKIQTEIKDQLGLPVSIGISSNKFVAKMSTQINKPYGITLTKSEDFLKVFGDWKLNKFHGIGKVIASKLNAVSLKTIKDLAIANVNDLTLILGKNAFLYIDKAKGIDYSNVNTEKNEVKSIGKSITFQDRDRSSRREILNIFLSLCKAVSNRTKEKSLVGSVISVSIKKKGSNNIRATSKQIKLRVPVQDYESLFKEGTSLFDLLWKGEVIKFIGISLTNLEDIKTATYQSSLFDKENLTLLGIRT